MRTARFATISLDLDNKWSYLKTHGDSGWRTFPSYLDKLVKRVLPIFEERGLKITFFVVGQDAALEVNREALKAISDAGHEIGNHSYNHDPWFHLFSEDEINSELARTEELIERICGSRPLGYRAPGFSLSQTTLQVLSRRGYQYDCSTFPTFLGPLARAYYFMSANLTQAEQEKRKRLFGGFKEGFRPVKPYKWRTPDGLGLLEIPVTTMPLVKIPIHVSYLLYLSRFSALAARVYFSWALKLCTTTGTEPSILLHPLDFLGGDDVDGLSFFPGMDLKGREKVKRVCEYIDMLLAGDTILPMGKYTDLLGKRKANLAWRVWG